MMRLPYFRYRAPGTVQEAAEMLANSSGETRLIAGGTDLLPNMKRRQQVPTTLIGLRQVAGLRRITSGEDFTIGAAVTLATLVRNAEVHASYTALWQAAAQVATPHLRNMGTIGGNLCLDTRCNYYDQNYEWRKAIDFCLKKDGTICWVAPSSPRCLAVSSADTVPALLALRASVTLTSASGIRQIPVASLYRNDGIHYLTRTPGEIVTDVRLPRLDGWRSAYWKLRRRGAFDFPVLGVAAAVKQAADGTVESARIVLGAIASSPVETQSAADTLVGDALTDEAIARAADLAAQPARPMDNTDFTLHWRKRVIRDFVTCALREIRGDDVREARRRVARQMLM
jgi:4-hydroxybenzoyl-CoA reductase subunit beta